MKPLLRKLCLTAFTVAAFLSPRNAVQAQTAYEYLNQTNISARFNADGSLFWDGKNAYFEAPKGSGQHTISSAGLWIGGMDKQGQLHQAAQTFFERGADYFPGPLDTSTGLTNVNLSASYNKVWKVSKLEIDSFRAGLAVPASVMNWPGNGDVSKGVSRKLAPFVDLNGNGIYEPAQGDYPQIEGDVMLWWVFNDQLSTHGESQSPSLGLEIQASAYTYNSTDPVLANTVFLKYRIINRSGLEYDSTYVGMWTDLDIGNIFDDYVGSDSSLNTYYAYNGEPYDRDTTVRPKTGGVYSYKGYGGNLPVQAVSFLQGINDDKGMELPMTSFIYYNNDTGSIGNPKVSADYYDMLKGHWADGSPLTYGGNGYGGSQPVHYAFPGDPGNNNQWTEQSAKNIPEDRRGLGSFGPFSLKSGEEKEMTVAFSFHRADNGEINRGVSLMKNHLAELEKQYRSHALRPCTGLSLCTTGDSCVFPGDANHDGKAYRDDIFRIGYAFGETGPQRSYASARWAGQPAASWTKSFPDGLNFRHADTNGDGIIDSADVLPLVLNYAETHAKEDGMQGTSTDPALALHMDQDSIMAGKVLSGTITLGTQDLPADNVYGAALTLTFDSAIIVPGSFTMDLSGGGLGDIKDLISFYKQNVGKIDIGIVRNNKLPKQVKDIIIRWKIVIDGNVIFAKTTSAAMEGQVVDATLNPITVTTSGAQFKVLPTSIQPLKTADLDKSVSLYPNPAQNQLTLALKNTGEAQVRIYNIQGKEMQTFTHVNDTNFRIDVASYPEGLYLVQVSTAQGIAVKKFLKSSR
jgi:hypothetical protein